MVIICVEIDRSISGERGTFPTKYHSGIIEAEVFNIVCPGDVYYDRTEMNEGGQYRENESIDIEKYSAGGYNVAWMHTGEWIVYTIELSRSTTYQVSCYIASQFESRIFYLEK